MDLADKIEKSRFLGREFLLWLWYESERDGGVVALPGKESCELLFEEHLTLATDGVLAPASSTLRALEPSGSPEAKEALRQRKLPTKAKLRLFRGPQSWSFVLAADTLAVSGVKVPALIKEEGEERFYERMHLVEELEAHLDGLFERFVELRTSPGWDADVLPSMRRWTRDED